MNQELARSVCRQEPGTASDWWRSAVIYQVYVRSFADSNGDGVGDLRGVRSRLPYLADLGVDALWLTPFYASPQADAGYDVADYRAVDPLFGDLSDADDLVREAHAHGLRIIVDVPVLRDGCRVPLPWSGYGAPYGFGPATSWLPQPDEWRGLSVEAQTGDPLSTLELYRSALRLRRELPGLGGGAMTWLESAEGVLAFARPGFACTANTTGAEVEIPVPGRLLLSTALVDLTGGRCLLPADSCTWWAV